MIEKGSLAKLFRLFATTIENLDQQQIDQLLAGKVKLTFTVAGKGKEKNNIPPIDQATVLASLNGCKNREDARRVLSAITGRDVLAALARTLKVHVIKNDRREDIEAKIIEFVIGGKLRTEAIQSLNLKGGNGPANE
jgi:hypothetical protein